MGPEDRSYEYDAPLIISDMISQGDSGGPLQTENAANPGTYTQFGITSFGPAFCGVKETPGVYTKVSKYVPWIERIVWPTG